LEAIHLFVEILGAFPSYLLQGLHLRRLSTDTFFDNVCELDLVFNFYKVRRSTILSLEYPVAFVLFQVYAILDEIFLAGEIEETSKDVVLMRLEELEKLE
jgi:AP-2 complex subunit sigma-1